MSPRDGEVLPDAAGARRHRRPRCVQQRPRAVSVSPHADRSLLPTEGPGWPRFDIDAPSRCGLVYLPEIVRDHFIDENAEATPEGKLWPQGTQCLVDEGGCAIVAM